MIVQSAVAYPRIRSIKYIIVFITFIVAFLYICFHSVILKENDNMNRLIYSTTEENDKLNNNQNSYVSKRDSNEKSTQDTYYTTKENPLDLKTEPNIKLNKSSKNNNPLSSDTDKKSYTNTTDNQNTTTKIGNTSYTEDNSHKKDININNININTNYTNNINTMDSSGNSDTGNYSDREDIIPTNVNGTKNNNNTKVDGYSTADGNGKS